MKPAKFVPTANRPRQNLMIGQTAEQIVALYWNPARHEHALEHELRVASDAELVRLAYIEYAPNALADAVLDQLPDELCEMADDELNRRLAARERLIAQNPLLARMLARTLEVRAA